MSATPRASSSFAVSPAVVPESQGMGQDKEQSLRTSRAEITRLAALHLEAKETARLSNLLGRMPATATLLTLAAGVSVVLMRGDVSFVSAATWLVLVLAAIGAIARSYTHTMRAPFERAPLVAFAHDLNATMFYAGFAWGAGAYLALPQSTSILQIVIFSAGICIALATTLRARDAALWFVAPVMFLCAFASVLRPFDGGALGATVTLVACGTVAAALIALDRFSHRLDAAPSLSDLQLT